MNALSKWTFSRALSRSIAAMREWSDLLKRILDFNEQAVPSHGRNGRLYGYRPRHSRSSPSPSQVE